MSPQLQYDSLKHLAIHLYGDCGSFQSQGEMRGKNGMEMLEGGTKEVGSVMKTLGKEATLLQSSFSTGVIPQDHSAKQSSHGS